MTPIVPEVRVSEGTSFAELMPHERWRVSDAFEVWSQHVVFHVSLTPTEVRFPYPLPPASEMRAHLNESDRAAARSLAQTFADQIYEEPGVAEVWFHHEGTQAVVSVVTQDYDLERDLRLQATFIGLQRDLQSETASYLEIFAEAEGIPDSVSTGMRL